MKKATGEDPTDQGGTHCQENSVRPSGSAALEAARTNLLFFSRRAPKRPFSMFKQIISLKNIEQAYLKIAGDMELDGRAQRYCGWDSWKLADTEIRLPVLLRLIKAELEDLTPIVPAVLFKIPKKSNPQKLREIYIYNLKERIKAQAIYQIVEPVFDAYFSPYLFSYRSSHSSYFAARSAVRHYHKYWQRDFVFIGDLSDYSNYIRHDCLKEQIEKLPLDNEVKALLFLFIGNEVIRDGAIEKPPVGLVQGVPLIALFNNLYLDAFDKYAGVRSDFYRRVGDDLIIFDRLESRIRPLEEELRREADRLGLKINQEKTKMQAASQAFSFLGYRFEVGKVGLTPNFSKALIQKWRQQFPYYRSRSEQRKRQFLKQSIRRDRNNLREQFKQLAEQKKLVNNEAQLRRLSEAFFRVLTKYFFKDYSERNRRLLATKLKKIGLMSVYKYFLKIRYDTVKRKN